MSELSLTMIDSGAGDSLLIESKPQSGQTEYALIDSNDSVNLRPTEIYLRRFLRKRGLSAFPVFKFILLTHDHSDHIKGLQAAIRDFGCEQFWYSQVASPVSLPVLTKYLKRYHQGIPLHEIRAGSPLPLASLGDATLAVWWPRDGAPADPNENNNSVVLQITLADISFLLTGDAEGPAWTNIVSLPHADFSNVRVVKVPHHGGETGTFDKNATPWLSVCNGNTCLGISCDGVTHGHPHDTVIDAFGAHDVYRTDENYHLTFLTDGSTVTVKWSRV